MSDASTGRAALRWLPDPNRISPADDVHTLVHVHHRPDDDICNCPLPSLGGDFDAERWLSRTPVTRGEAHGWTYARAEPGLVFAARHIDDGEDPGTPGAIQQAALAAYTGLFALQRELGLRHVQRIWHWLSAVTAGDGDDERYKRFCRGRAEALDLPGHDMTTLPPATLVAGHCRGVRLHVLLGDRPVTPIENPRQVSAYDYPRQYGERAPAFARAGRVELGGTPYLLISGTASIVGHKSRHIGDVAAQTHEALDNVAAVMANADAWDPATGLAALECLKAYIRVPGDATTIQAIAKARAPGVPIALLHAPLCREELLVEFEAQMPLT